MASQEKNIFVSVAAVYNLDPNTQGWVSIDGGNSKVYIFHNPSKEAYRVVGMSLTTNQYVLNARVFKGLAHQSVSDKSIVWQDPYQQKIFCLTFGTAESAQQFSDQLTAIVTRLNDEEDSAQPSSNTTPTPSPVPQHQQQQQQQQQQQPTPTPQITSSPSVTSIERTGSSGNLRSSASLSSTPQKEKTKQKKSLFTLQKKTRKTSVIETKGPAPGSPEDIISREPGPNSLSVKTGKLTDRERVVCEIYETEKTYVKSLITLVNKCMEPLRTSKSIFSQDEQRKIFGNVEILLPLNIQFYQDLQNKLDTWSDDTRISSVFLAMIPFFKVYKEYCNNYDEAVSELERIEKKRKEVAAYVKSCETLSEGHRLPFLLIQPVQRIPRYSLLLRELVRKTEEGHADYNDLKKALDETTAFTSQINESVRQTANFRKLASLASDPKKYVGFDKIVQPHRHLIFEGNVKVQLPDKTLTWMLLFDDILVFASEIDARGTSRVEEEIPLYLVWLDDLALNDGGASNKKNSAFFQVLTPNASFLVDVTPKDKKMWLSMGKRTIDAFISAKGFTSRSHEGRRVFQFQYPDGVEYSGDWEGAKYHGEGILRFAEGAMYQGSFLNGKMNGEGHMTWTNGEKYTGGFLDDKPHGEGKLQTQSGTYSGAWVKGSRHGKGTLSYTNGDKYEGDWENNWKCGKGVWTSGSTKYEGMWKNDKFHGTGTYTYHEGTYEGEWVESHKHGTGKMVMAYGDTYEGQFKCDMRHGKGVLCSVDGRTRYSGDFSEGRRHGHGEYTVQGVVKYIGHWKDDRRHGAGREERTDGTVYDGTWADDRKEGRGKLALPTGEIYDGTWHSDKKFGQGILTLPNNSKYDGEWVNNRKEGKGTFTWATGEVYVGGWMSDKRHGKGTFTLAGQRACYTGEWFNDCRKGQGQMKDKQGVYDGQWDNDMRDGQGTFTDNLGNVFSGGWKNDRLEGHSTLCFANGEEVSCFFQGGQMERPRFSVLAPPIPPPFTYFKR